MDFMNNTLRDAVPDDAQALAHIIVTATQTALTGLVPEACRSWLTPGERAACYERAVAAGDDPARAMAAADEARSAENWRKTLAEDFDRGEFLLLAEEDGVPVGYAMGAPRPADPVFTGQLTALHVLPSRQGRGLGRLLVRETARRLAAQGIHSLRVGVLCANPSRSFYEHLGARYLYAQDFDAGEGCILAECVYGWQDTADLQHAMI